VQRQIIRVDSTRRADISAAERQSGTGRPAAAAMIFPRNGDLPQGGAPWANPNAL
jgi:hypothetical protein